MCVRGDAGETEIRSVPSRVRPCPHKCFSEPQSVRACVCASVLRHLQREDDNEGKEQLTDWGKVTTEQTQRERAR